MLDRDSFETPDALFNDLWLRAGSAYTNLTNALAEALTRFLHDGWSAWPERVPGISYALRLASVRPLEPARTLFREVAQRAPTFAPEPDALDLLWVEAAAVQTLGADASVWLDLLKFPRYASAAYSALEQNEAVAAANLPAFWQVLTFEDRELVIEQAISRLISAHGDRILETILCEATRSEETEREWPPDLKSSVNQALGELGRPPLFRRLPDDARQRAAPDPWRSLCAQAQRACSTLPDAANYRDRLILEFPVNDQDARALLARAGRGDADTVSLETEKDVVVVLKFAPNLQPDFVPQNKRISSKQGMTGFAIEVEAFRLVQELKAALAAPARPASRSSNAPAKPSAPSIAG